MERKTLVRWSGAVLLALALVAAPTAAWAAPVGVGGAGWVGGWSWLMDWVMGWAKTGPTLDPDGLAADSGPHWDPGGLQSGGAAAGAGDREGLVNAWEKTGPGWDPDGFQSQGGPFDQAGPTWDPGG